MSARRLHAPKETPEVSASYPRAASEAPDVGAAAAAAAEDDEMMADVAALVGGAQGSDALASLALHDGGGNLKAWGGGGNLQRRCLQLVSGCAPC